MRLEEEREEEYIYALPDDDEDSPYVLISLTPEEVAAILDAPETDESDYMARHNAYNPVR